MWPRILLELLPHLGKLVPVADKLLAARTLNGSPPDPAALADGLRSNLDQLGELHAGIERTLRDQAEQISALSVEVTRTRLGVEATEARIDKLERTTRTNLVLSAIAIALLLATLPLMTVLALHQHHS
jgi:hypothetical protein